MSKPTITVYAFCYNEEYMLPYFFRHYDQYDVDYVIHDNESTDASARMIDAHPRARRIVWDTGGRYLNGGLRDVKNSCWKGSTSDWVIVCDIDEFLYHPRLLNFLAGAQATILQPYAWEMVSPELPSTTGQLYDEVQTGVRLPMYDKVLAFRPSAITEIDYDPGSHHCRPQGRVVRGRDDALKLLHFRYLSLAYVSRRFAEFNARRGPEDLTRRWGHHYEAAEAELASDLEALRESAVAVALAS